MSFTTSKLKMMLLLFLAFLFLPNTIAQQTLFPPAIPLAVRSPYLSCWDHVTNGTIFGQLWPTTTNPSQILGWSVIVRVDGLAYSVLGSPRLVNATANLTNIVVTPTQTVVTAQAGAMQANLTFLNPIEPGDWVKQSIPFSYMAFTAKSLDGAAHTVQVYSDVSGEWNSGDRSQVILWGVTSSSSAIYHSVRLQTSAVFNEISNQAEWGNLYYAMKAGNNITYKIDVDDTARGMFIVNGVLDNQEDATFRPIASQFAVFAISRDLGTIQAAQTPVVWAVGYTTDPAINFTDSSGSRTTRSLFYKSQYSDDGALLVDFLNDFTNASSRAQQLDRKILQDAASVSNRLGDLVSLAIAQVYGSTQLTIGTDAFGNFNKSDVMMFMKNIGGEHTNRVNAVETLYSAFPAFMYIDASLGAPLLEPLFRLQAPLNSSIPYAAADLGSNYPNITGRNFNENQAVEQSGNMLIMTYAYARATGDGSLISRYYALLTSWADYLKDSTLFIHNQSSADGLSATNQTNLAIKGIIAIQAMSKMSLVVKQSADADKYSSAAASLYSQWKGLALGSDQHLPAVYGQTNTWTLGYNLFADVWLGTNLIESSVYNGQSSFIDNVTLTSAFSNFGMPVDNLLQDTSVAVSSWNLFAAAMTPDGDLRSQLISRVHNRASFNISAGVFPLEYDSTHGSTILGAASPAQGAVYAPLALKVPVLPITAKGPAKSKAPTSTSHTGTIVGAVTGGVAAVLSVIGVIFVQRRRRLHRRKSIESFSSSTFIESGPQAIVTPFNPIPLGEISQSSDSWMEQQQLLSGPPEAEAVPEPHNLSSTPPSSLPRSRPTAPVPAGLSSKELARLRAEAQQAPSHPLSNESRSTPSTPSLTSAAGQSGVAPSSETRRLQSEVESLRREMQQLRTERLEAPPSYTEGDS